MKTSTTCYIVLLMVWLTLVFCCTVNADNEALIKACEIKLSQLHSNTIKGIKQKPFDNEALIKACEIKLIHLYSISNGKNIKQKASDKYGLKMMEYNNNLSMEHRLNDRRKRLQQTADSLKPIKKIDEQLEKLFESRQPLTE